MSDADPARRRPDGSRASVPPPTPIACSSAPGVLSEGPRWNASTGELLWVDILGATFHRARPSADGTLALEQVISLDRPVGAVAPAVGGGWVLAAGTGFIHVDDTGTLRELAQPEAGRTDVRMNDGACDAAGRFWAGTMAYDEAAGAGALYRLELDGTCTTMLTDLTISNGIGWSPGGDTMYLADSGTARIDAFDFDAASGDVTRRRTIITIDEPGVAPDGLTVDRDGDLWVALWNGSAIRRYSSDGTLLTEVSFPVDRPTSCAFGGHDASTLYATTARQGLEPTALARQPDAGRVFRVEGLGTTGPACSPYRGQIKS